MHFVIKNNIGKEGQYLSGEIVGHVSGKIAHATNLLDKLVIDYVKEECGKQASENCKIIDVHSLDQVAEPSVDGIRLYRIDTEPTRIHVYQRISKQVEGRLYGHSVLTEFHKNKIFEVLSYKYIIPPPPVPAPEMIKVGPSNMEYPKSMTQAPMIDLISALKSSEKFLRYKAEND